MRTDTTTVIASFTIEGHVFDVVRTDYTWDYDDVVRSWYSAVDADGTHVWRNANYVKSDEHAVVLAKSGVKKHLADVAIEPVAAARALDYGRDFGPSAPDFVPATRDNVKVGDDAWVYSYQAWRRGVVEKIGRTNITVAVVVKNTGTFSRQSVKPDAEYAHDGAFVAVTS